MPKSCLNDIEFDAENTALLNHGLMRRYVFENFLCCSLLDFALMWPGINGVSCFEDSFGGCKAGMLAFATAWLFA